MTHPLSKPTHPRVDICQGGTQDAIMKDSLALARHAARELTTGEHVLIINSLCSSKLLEQTTKQISSHQKGSVLAYSAWGAKLREKLEFLTATIEEKSVRLVIFNCWELASANGRQKRALAMWIRELRDEHGVCTVIYSIDEASPRNGALMLLAWLSDSLMKTGDWAPADKLMAKFRKNSNAALEEYLSNDATETAVEDEAEKGQEEEKEEEAVLLGGEVDREQSPFVDRNTRNRILSGQPLKTNDLTRVRARTLELVEV